MLRPPGHRAAYRRLAAKWRLYLCKVFSMLSTLSNQADGRRLDSLSGLSPGLTTRLRSQTELRRQDKRAAMKRPAAVLRQPACSKPAYTQAAQMVDSDYKSKKSFLESFYASDHLATFCRYILPTVSCVLHTCASKQLQAYALLLASKLARACRSRVSLAMCANKP